MKYQKQIDKIESGSMTRAELVKLKENAENLVLKRDADAMFVLHAINEAKPADPYYVFMGFCPDANIENRLDTEWKERGGGDDTNNLDFKEEYSNININSLHREKPSG